MIATPFSWRACKRHHPFVHKSVCVVPARSSLLRITSLFTGIVQGKATVKAVERRQDSCSFDLTFPTGATESIKIGASVAINGTCLTVVKHDKDTLTFDVIGETLKRTNLGSLEQGSAVNYERSARMGDEIGGHAVSGHVQTTASIRSITSGGEENTRLELDLEDPLWLKYILPKGFVAVDGCSLTVGEVTETGFGIYLIPETLRVTVLGDKEVGDTVNIEVEAQTQAIVDTVERVVAKYLK
jgi:riboflavin synthase